MQSNPPAEEVSTAGDSGRSKLDRSLVSGIAWTAATRFSLQAVSWAALVILAKLLSPGDFGLLGMTTLFLGLAAMVSECGIDGAIILATSLSLLKIRRMHTLSVLLGVCGTFAGLLAARWLADFFHSPKLVQILPVMALGLAVSGFRVVPQALLLKEMRFRALSGIEVGQGLTQSMTALLLAWLGWGYWALVVSGLLGNVVASSALLLLRPCGFAWPTPRHIASEFTFSRRLLASRLAWYFYSNSDFIVAGRFLGTSALGVYTIAWNIANVPVDKLSALLTRVTPAIFARVQSEHEEMRRYLLLLTQGLSMITVPIGLGMALVSQSLVPAVFDARWRDAATPLCLLALYSVPRCLAVLLPPCLNALGDVRFVMWQSIGYVVLFPPIFVYASKWGGAGIAAGWLCVYPVAVLPMFLRCTRRLKISPSEYSGAMRPAVVGGAAMTAAVLAVQYLTGGLHSPILKLAIEVPTGAAVYSAILWLFFRRQLMKFLRVVLRKGFVAA